MKACSGGIHRTRFHLELEADRNGIWSWRRQANGFKSIRMGWVWQIGDGDLVLEEHSYHRALEAREQSPRAVVQGERAECRDERPEVPALALGIVVEACEEPIARKAPLP
jgi:hypothetical protein